MPHWGPICHKLTENDRFFFLDGFPGDSVLWRRTNVQQGTLIPKTGLYLHIYAACGRPAQQLVLLVVDKFFS